jgi:DNA-binding MarR family transcriptional regulator
LRRSVVDKLASYLERLKKAGVYADEITPEITDHERAVLERLTDDEVETLIRMHRKFGPAPKGREKMRPNFIL